MTPLPVKSWKCLAARLPRWGVALVLWLGLLLAPMAPAFAGPVDWQEVPASAEGRQWWDAGSVRTNAAGVVTVLSRFQPAAPEPVAPAEAGDVGTAPGSRNRPPLADLYVMELDCGQALFRDVSVNGLPRWRAPWQLAGDDTLIQAVLQEVCAAAGQPQPIS